MRKIALYSRVSCSTQSVAGQQHRLRMYAKCRDEEVVEFADEGVSGARASRPALDEMLDACRRREVGTIVCTALDRIGRSTLNLAQLAAELEALDVSLVVLGLNLDSSTPTGRLMFSMLSAIAGFERDICKARIADGVALARARGVKFGRPPLLDDKAVARARRMRESGRSWRHCGEVLGVSHSTVIAALRA
jgi:DNA invertase Pin-like site-specific DNA recombinase